MSEITAAAVAALRARTGVSILACKQALEEANGDQEKAIELLRKRGIAQAVKKADRVQSEGAIFAAEDGAKAAIVILKCETDFVSRSDDFQALGKQLASITLQDGVDAGRKEADAHVPLLVQKLGENITLGEVQQMAAPSLAVYVHSNNKLAVIIGTEPAGADHAKLKDVAMHAAALNPQYVSPDEVTEEAVAKERDIWTEQLKKDNKPQQIMDKIMLGKEKKFREENSLLKQPFVKDPNQTVEQYLGDAKVTVYERITV